MVSISHSFVLHVYRPTKYLEQQIQSLCKSAVGVEGDLKYSFEKLGQYYDMLNNNWGNTAYLQDVFHLFLLLGKYPSVGMDGK